MPGPKIDLSVYADEEHLLTGLRAGEPDACTCLVKRFAPLVYAQALRLVNDPDEAEGVLQETFIKACAKIGDFEQRSGLGTWLYRIATNQALMWLRRRRTNPVPLEAVAEMIQPDELPQNLSAWQRDPVSTVLDNELHAQLESALATLPESLRVVFVLRELYGLSTEKTATALELGESAVKVRLHRARLRLRELLANYMTKPVGDADE